MSDESPLSRALRIAMQNHVSAYGGRNALDQGDYGYGTPVTYSNPNFMSSSGLQHQGPWMREYMPSTLADLLSQILTYAPMAVPAMRGRVMEGGLRPQDYAVAPAMERNALNMTPKDYGPDIMGGTRGRTNGDAMNAEGLSDMRGMSDPQHWHNYGMHPADMAGHRAPRPSNFNDAPQYTIEGRGPGLSRQEMEKLGFKFEVDPRYRQEPFDFGTNNGSQFNVIPGGKE